MNIFRDLLHLHAHRLRLTVDDHAWLALVHDNPTTATITMTSLTFLDADGYTLALAAHALDVLGRALGHADPRGADRAHAELTQITADLIRQADAAAQIWTAKSVPALIDAGVLRMAAAPERDCPHRQPRHWVDGNIELPGIGGPYPGLIAARRMTAGRPIVRFDLEVCQRIAADLADATPAALDQTVATPVVLVDHDTPILSIPARKGQPWPRDAELVFADNDDRYRLGVRWPWQPR